MILTHVIWWLVFIEAFAIGFQWVSLEHLRWPEWNLDISIGFFIASNIMNEIDDRWIVWQRTLNGFSFEMVLNTVKPSNQLNRNFQWKFIPRIRFRKQKTSKKRHIAWYFRGKNDYYYDYIDEFLVNTWITNKILFQFNVFFEFFQTWNCLSMFVSFANYGNWRMWSQMIHFFCAVAKPYFPLYNQYSLFESNAFRGTHIKKILNYYYF